MAMATCFTQSIIVTIKTQRSDLSWVQQEHRFYDGSPLDVHGINMIRTLATQLHLLLVRGAVASGREKHAADVESYAEQLLGDSCPLLDFLFTLSTGIKRPAPYEVTEMHERPLLVTSCARDIIKSLVARDRSFPFHTLTNVSLCGAGSVKKLKVFLELFNLCSSTNAGTLTELRRRSGDLHTACEDPRMVMLSYDNLGFSRGAAGNSQWTTIAWSSLPATHMADVKAASRTPRALPSEWTAHARDSDRRVLHNLLIGIFDRLIEALKEQHLAVRSLSRSRGMHPLLVRDYLLHDCRCRP